MSRKKLVIVGAGQIGASLAMATALNHPDYEIVAYDNACDNPNITAEFLQALGNNRKNVSTDNIRFTTDPKETAGADLVVLATRVRNFDAAIKTLAPYVTTQTVFTDVGSVKGLSQERIRKTLDTSVGSETSYVPFHILNGNAGSGPLTADPSVFKAPGVLVPGAAPQYAEDMVEGFFTSLGTTVHKMSAATHDKVVGTMSHLEHVIMFSVMKTDFMQDLLNQRGAVDPGNWVQRMTRIADAGEKMWADNFLDNRNEILQTAAHLHGMLNGFRNGVASEASLDSAIDILHSFAKDKIGKELSAFPSAEIESGNAGIHGFFGVLSMAITANAKRTEEEARQPLAPIANPSFKDGLGPIAVASENVKKLFHFDRDGAPRKNVRTVSSPTRDAIAGHIIDFLNQFDKTVALIKANDAPGIMQLVTDVKVARKALPQSFAAAPAVSRPSPAADAKPV